MPQFTYKTGYESPWSGDFATRPDFRQPALQSPTIAMARRRYASKQRAKQPDLVSEFQRAQDEAKAANERRYQEIKGGYERRYGDAMGMLDQLGGQQRADLEQSFGQAADKQRAFLTGRGLSGTSLGATLDVGRAREQAAASRRLEEALTRERLGYQTGLSQDKLQFMERREDAYPDFRQLQALAYMQGQGQGGGRSYGMNPAMANALSAGRGWTGAIGGRKNVNFRMPGVGLPQRQGQLGIAKSGVASKPRQYTGMEFDF